jgi:Cytochrome oxidase complex assembly protein 1
MEAKMAPRKMWLHIAKVTAIILLAGALCVFGSYRGMELCVMNRDGIDEAKERIADRPELQARLGDPIRFGLVFHGSYDWWAPGGGEMEVYIPVSGSKSSGVLYLRDFDDIGAWKLREMKFKPSGQEDWIDCR